MHAQKSEEREAVSGKLANPKVTYWNEKKITQHMTRASHKTKLPTGTKCLLM